MNSLTPGSSDFSYGQQAIFDIYPASNYPYGCNSTVTTLTNREGTVHDGSATKNYQANQDCRWLIQPIGNIDHLIFEFDEFNLGNGDTLYFYDGASVNASFLGKFTGNNLPANFNSNTNSVLIQLKTDASNHQQGFGLSYRSVNTVYCSGITQLTLDSAGLSDGSQSNKYNNGTLCRWYIKPTNGQPIKLTFTSLDTEAGKDIIKVYDPSLSPSKLLGVYSGDVIPKPIVSTSGEMMVIFSTNQNNPKQGWDAYYISSATVGIDEIALNNSISVYPNPTTSKLNIRFDIAMQDLNIFIYSADGRLLNNIHKDQANDPISISTSMLPEGFYIMKIQSNKGVFTRTFVVQR